MVAGMVIVGKLFAGCVVRLEWGPGEAVITRCRSRGGNGGMRNGSSGGAAQ